MFLLVWASTVQWSMWDGVGSSQQQEPLTKKSKFCKLVAKPVVVLNQSWWEYLQTLEI